MTAPEEDQRVQAAVRQHARDRAFTEVEQVISFVLSDPQVRQAREQVETAETRLEVLSSGARSPSTRVGAVG